MTCDPGDGVKHYPGCACHEARREAEILRLARHLGEADQSLDEAETRERALVVKLAAADEEIQALTACEDSQNEDACGACLACYRVGRDHALRQRAEALARERELRAENERLLRIERIAGRALADIAGERVQVPWATALRATDECWPGSARAALSPRPDAAPVKCPECNANYLDRDGHCAFCVRVYAEEMQNWFEQGVPPETKCSCGKPATCVGQYESMTSPEPACDDCCAHGNEDGRCEPIERAAKPAVATFAKRCREHGAQMRHVRKFSGARWWECPDCAKKGA